MLRFRNLGNETATFKAEAALVKALKELDFSVYGGLTVAVAKGDEPTVGLGTDGGEIYGFATNLEGDDCVTVTRCGIITNVKGDGLIAGNAVVLDGAGGVKAGAGKAIVIATENGDEGTVVDLK